MKKRIITLVLLLLCFCQILSAQKTNGDKPHSDLHNELGINAGPFSLVGSFTYGTIGFWTAIGGGISHKPVEMNLCGNYSIHYYYQVKPWCQVGIKAMVEAARVKHYSDTLRTRITSVDHYALLSVMPSVRFTYLNRPWVRLYSGVDLGCAYLWSGTTDYSGGKAGEKSKDNNFLFAFNVTAFGVNVGKKFYGLFELNAGFDSMVKVGIGARF